MLRSLHIGKSKKIFKEIKYFLDGKGYNVEKSANEEEGVVFALSVQRISDLINCMES